MKKLQSVKLEGSRFGISRERDGAGDSGMMLSSLDPEQGYKPVGDNGEIRVGCRIKCGTPYARTFGQGWWMTTVVTEILEVSEDRTFVRFKTGNSIYQARGF